VRDKRGGFEDGDGTRGVREGEVFVGRWQYDVADKG